MNHYQWLDLNFKTFLKNIGEDPEMYVGAISCDGDKTSQYEDTWEDAGVPFFHGTAIYLLTKSFPWSNEVRQTDKGWVPVETWIIDNYPKFKKDLPQVD